MPEQLRALINRIMEWWKRFSTRQKTIIITVAVVVVVAIVVLVTLLNRKTYVVLLTAESTQEASEITGLFDSNAIDYVTDDSGTQISVLESQEAQANLLLGANNIPTDSYTIDNVTSGGFSTTESDKQKRYKVFLEQKLAATIEANSLVKKATVDMDIPEDDGTLISQDKESFAAITLELLDDMDEDTAASLARVAATALGNQSTDNITIVDTEGNLLFSGEDASTVGGATATTQLSMKQKAEQLVKNEVKSVLLGTELYDNVEVASNLDLDFSKSTVVDHQYTAAPDQTQGVLSSEDLYQSDSTGGVAGVPGTTSNDDDTTYVMEDYQTSSESVTEESRKYLPNEKVTTTEVPAGLIKYETSTVSVAAKAIHIYKEEEVKEQGLLTDISWEEFQAANGEQVKLEVDESLYEVVHTATGIPAENISIVAYEVPVFVDKEGANIQATDIIQIVIILIILALLAFVILRSMRTEKEEEPVEELSVESLLQSTPTEQLEDIELEEKSETRRMIEKFVDENPEAVASLLRNWLAEDWG
ncbi:MAG: flagellar M-ring protein FliF [Lachnospiraceae bacterium]|nr:flagellar M-ring protein FliF [Lachnospiraceae bacterium]